MTMMDLENKIKRYVKNQDKDQTRAMRLLMKSPFSEDYSTKEIRRFQPKKAAVLVLWHQNELGQWQFPLILRNVDQGPHSGQISLPGGGVNLLETAQKAAIRETNEEINTSLSYDLKLYPLQEIYLSISNYLVYPFVTFHKQSLQMSPNPKEVQAIFLVNLSMFLKDSYKSSFTVNKEGLQRVVPSFLWHNQKVWGLTAMILNEIRAVLKS